MAAAENVSRLIYISHSKDLLGPQALERILLKSREFNPTISVTGLLLYHDGSFLQVIEGPQSSLDILMTKIRHDRRHGGLITLHHAPARSRAFEEWSMAFIPMSGLSTFQQKGAFDLFAFATDRSLIQADTNHVIEVQINAFLSTFREFEAV